MPPKISLIVPVYNAERYLPKCVDSILAQTYRDLELLLIDDGSTDRSPQLCDGYALTDSRIRVFHQPNRGVGAARNLGISQASGDYLGFVDADDYVDADYLERFQPGQADVCLQGVVVETGQAARCISQPDRVLPDRQAVADYVAGAIPMADEGLVLRAVCSKLFRREVVASLRYDEEMSFAEDYLLNLLVYQRVETMTLASACGYHYQQQHSTLSVRKYPIDRFLAWHRIQQDAVLRLARHWAKPEMFAAVVDKRFSHLYRILLSSPSYTLREKYSAYAYMHGYLNRPECQGIGLEDIVCMLQRLPFGRLSFYIVMGRVGLARLRMRLMGANG